MPFDHQRKGGTGFTDKSTTKNTYCCTNTYETKEKEIMKYKVKGRNLLRMKCHDGI